MQSPVVHFVVFVVLMPWGLIIITLYSLRICHAAAALFV